MSKKRAGATRVLLDGIEMQAWVTKRAGEYVALCLPVYALARGRTIKEVLLRLKESIIAWRFPSPIHLDEPHYINRRPDLLSIIEGPDVRSFKLTIDFGDDPSETVELFPASNRGESLSPLQILFNRLFVWKKADPRSFLFHDAEGRT